MSEKIPFPPYPDHEGLQPVAIYRSQWPDHSGMTFVPHSDKQAVSTVQEHQQPQPTTIPTISISGLPRYHPLTLPTRTPPPRYCGLTKRGLIIAVVLLACIVFGAGIGGGVGGAVARRKSSSDTPSTVLTYTSAGHVATSTVTSADASSTSSNIPPNGLGTYNCPAQNGSVYTSSIDMGKSFAVLCDVEMSAGVAGAVGGVVSDMNTGVVAGSIEACIDACVGTATWTNACAVVTYQVNVTAALEKYGSTGNCVFKSQRAKVVYDVTEEEGMISAYQVYE